MTEENEPENEARSFAHFLATLGSGALAELGAELFELTKSLHDESRSRNGKVKGSIALTLNFECSKEQIVAIAYAVKAKRPEPQRSATIAWATSAGHLTPQNPAQTMLPLQEVKATPREVREIDPVTFREKTGDQ